MYKPNRIDNNECNECFKCNICEIIKKQKNKNKHDTRCKECDKKEKELQKKQLIIDQILLDTIVPGAASGTIYRCVRCRNIISESQYRIYNRCNRCFASNRS
jgi:hypothetical protein